MAVWDDINFADLAEVLGRTARGRGTGRVEQAAAQGTYDRNAISKYLAELQGRGADLATRQYQLAAPGARATNAVRGDTLANVQDVGVEGPIVRTGGQMPQITGGLRPSILSPETRSLGQSMSRNALLQQMEGDQFAPLPSAPNLTPLPQGNWLDTAINAGAGLSGILGALGGQGSGKGGGGSGLDIGSLLGKLFNRHPGRVEGDITGGNIPDLTAETDFGPFNPWQLPGLWGNPEQDLAPFNPNTLPGGIDPMRDYYEWLGQHPDLTTGRGGDVSWADDWWWGSDWGF